MRSLFVILSALFVAALVALKITSRDGEKAPQANPEPEAEATKASQTLPGRTRTAGPQAGQVTNAAEKPLRQKLEEEGRYTSIFAKEAEWKERFRRLKRGMTVQEAVAVMGEPPTFLLAAADTGGTLELKPLPTNEFLNVTSHAMFCYS